jgi:hypothetical protein
MRNLMVEWDRSLLVGLVQLWVQRRVELCVKVRVELRVELRRDLLVERESLSVRKLRGVWLVWLWVKELRVGWNGALSFWFGVVVLGLLTTQERTGSSDLAREIMCCRCRSVGRYPEDA